MGELKLILENQSLKKAEKRLLKKFQSAAPVCRFPDVGPAADSRDSHRENDNHRPHHETRLQGIRPYDCPEASLKYSQA